MPHDLASQVETHQIYAMRPVGLSVYEIPADVSEDTASILQAIHLLRRTKDTWSMLNEGEDINRLPYLITPIGVSWLQRAEQRLLQSIETYLCPQVRITSEQIATHLLKGASEELQAAAAALDIAARELLNITGKGPQAGRARTAAIRARQAAEGLGDL